MKTLFIIPSAIMSGIGSPEDRFVQTLHTIDSIKSRFSDVDILLCDASSECLDLGMISLLGVPFLDFSSTPRVTQIREEVAKLKLDFATDNVKDFYRLSILKNLTEIHVINTVLSQITHNPYDRIFKISGRYFLNNDFNLEKHNQPGKICLTPKKKTLIGANYTHSSHYHHCISWNFCSSIFSEMTNSFSRIEEYILAQVYGGLIGDIEHGLHLKMPENLIYDQQKYGVSGKVNNKKFHWS